MLYSIINLIVSERLFIIQLGELVYLKLINFFKYFNDLVR